MQLSGLLHAWVMAPGWHRVWPTRGGGHLPAVTPPTANLRASLEPPFNCPPNISTHFGRSWILMNKMDLLDDRAELMVGAAVSGAGPRTVNGLRDDSTVEERGDKMSGSGTQHHFLRHSLPTDSQGLATLAHFGVSTIAEATRAVKRMSQRELQHTFRAVRDGPASGSMQSPHSAVHAPTLHYDTPTAGLRNQDIQQ